MPEKFKMKTMDIVDSNIDYIAQRFPNVITETIEDGKVVRKIDFEGLKQELESFVISDKMDRYQMLWPEKKKAILAANSSINGTLRPLLDKSVNFGSTSNIYIEGDNLSALKLLRETYLGQVKLIYIDPPYNTGGDFLYNDDFSTSAEDYLRDSGQYDEQGNRLVTNTDANGRYHSDWLNMMYPRLKIAKDLLAPDGSIFISIDDNEYVNLRKLMDEIFGEQCFVTTLHVELSATQGMKVKAAQAGNIVKNAEYIVIYSRDGRKNIAQTVLYDYRPEYDEHYNSILDSASGAGYTSLKTAYGKPLSASLAKAYAENPDFRQFVEKNKDKIFCFDHMTGVDCSHFPVGKIVPFERNGKRYFVFNNGKQIRQLLFLGSSFGQCDDFDRHYGLRKIRGDWWKDFYLDMGNVSKEGDVTFPNGKKPVRLISQIIKMTTSDDDIVLDFFSGSATTAHAVMLQNAIDGSKRRFILVQLPEDISGDDQGYKTICDLGETRIKHAAEEIKNDYGLIADSVDFGFRVFSIDSSNMKDIYYNPAKVKQVSLLDSLSNIKEDRSLLDLLIQIMLELGVDLSAKIDEKMFAGKKGYLVSGNYIAACFDAEVDEKVIKALSENKPVYIVLRDSCFKDDATNINCEQLIKAISPSTELRVL